MQPCPGQSSCLHKAYTPLGGTDNKHVAQNIVTDSNTYNMENYTGYEDGEWRVAGKELGSNMALGQDPSKEV